jgi:hypothetical protein
MADMNIYSSKIGANGQKLWYRNDKRIAKKDVPEEYLDDGNGKASKLPSPSKKPKRGNTVACRKVDPAFYLQENYRPLVNARGKVVSAVKIFKSENVRVSQQIHEYARIQPEYRFSLIIWRDPWVILPVEGNIMTESGFSVKGCDIIDLPNQHLYVLSRMRSGDLDTELAKWSEETQPGGYEVEDKGYFICFNMADYISYLWGKPYQSDIESMYLSWETLSLLRGVFHCEIHNSVESHGFVIWIADKWVHIYEGYGGHFEGIYLKLPKEKWFEAASQLSKFKCKLQKEMLLCLFDFPRDIFEENYRCAEFEPIIFGKYVEVMRIA